jgi:putative addiction module component (TIGR02574 family)
MSSQAVKILDDAMKLSDAERADVAACLFASLDHETHANLDPAWESEIERRLHAIDNGKATMIPWEEARQRIFGNG